MVLTRSRNFYQVAVVDVNGDGRPDLVMSDGYVVSVQNNLGGRGFGMEQHFLAGMGINSVSAGDVNKDGRTDLVLANGGGKCVVPWEERARVRLPAGDLQGGYAGAS